MTSGGTTALADDGLAFGGPVRKSALTRWKAAGIHVALSTLIAATLLVAMYLLWYPPPYFEIMGGGTLVLLIAGCDVVLGPLITLIIFKPGKKGLKFDLACIALAQSAALLYGLSTMFEARPVFTVFAVDRFEVMTPSDIKDTILAQGSRPDFTHLSWTGPRMVGARLPADPRDREKLLFGELGGDLSALPRFYVVYDDIAGDVARRAQPIAALERKNPAGQARIADAVRAAGVPEERLGYVPIIGAFKSMAALVDRTTGRVLAYADANPW